MCVSLFATKTGVCVTTEDGWERVKEVEKALGNLPKGWKKETLGKGSQKGNGLVLREYTPKANPTGRQIRWHPGGGHHGSNPYWRVIDYNGKSGIIR